MNKTTSIIIIMVLVLFNPFIAKSQTTTDYWYEGYIYQKAAEEQRNVVIGDFLAKNGMEIDGITVFPMDADQPYRVFVNGMELEQEQLQTLFEKAPMELVKLIEVSVYDTPNSYFSGAVNILLNVGERAFFPSDQSLNPLSRFE